MHLNTNFLRIEPAFIPTKIIMFCYYGSKYMMISFFVVFLKSFGINPEQAGIITGIRSASQTLGGMFLGWLVDYTKKRKTVFVVTILMLILSLITMPLLGYVITRSNGIHENNKDFNRNGTIVVNVTDLHILSKPNNIFISNNAILFWCFLTFSVVFGFCDGIHGLIDGSVMTHVKNNGKGRTNYSYQRLWGSIGYGTVPIIAGVLLDSFRSSFFSYYMPVFYLFFFLSMIMLVCLMKALKSEKSEISEELQTQLPIDETEESKTKEKCTDSVVMMLLKTLSHFDVIVVVWNSFLNGVAGICQWGFIYLLMEDKMSNSTKTVMGISFIASSFIEAFVAPLIKGATKRLGNSFIAMSVSLLGYALTFFLYFLTKDGLMVFFINIIAGITYPFYLYTAQEEIYKLSKRECVSLMFTFDRGVYSGLGGGIGGVVAGSLYKAYGGRIMYLAIAVFYAISAVKTLLYGIYKKQKASETLEIENILI